MRENCLPENLVTPRSDTRHLCGEYLNQEDRFGILSDTMDKLKCEMFDRAMIWQNKEKTNRSKQC